MPVSFWVDEQMGLFFYNCHGFVTGAELLGAPDRRRAEVPGLYDIVVDLSRAVAVEITPPEMQELARTPMDPTRLAIVAPRPALFGLGRMFQINAEVTGSERQIEVFRTLEEAIRWLRGARSSGGWGLTKVTTA